MTLALSYYDDDTVREELNKEPRSRWAGLRKALAPSDDELLMALALADELSTGEWCDDYLGPNPDGTDRFISDELRAEVMWALAERLEP